jgi:hypothetical protein
VGQLKALCPLGVSPVSKSELHHGAKELHLHSQLYSYEAGITYLQQGLTNVDISYVSTLGYLMQYAVAAMHKQSTL